MKHQKIDQWCSFIVGKFPGSKICGKPATAMTPGERPKGSFPVCSLHQKALDNGYKKNGRAVKCKPIE